MVTCPSCSHSNPDHATHCEACYMPMPEVVTTEIAPEALSAQASSAASPVKQVEAEAQNFAATSKCPSCSSAVVGDVSFCGNCGYDLRPTVSAAEIPIGLPAVVLPTPPQEQQLETETKSEETMPPQPIMATGANKTQLQQVTAHLFHIQTESKIEIPPSLLIVHIGKPNNLIPPDIDLSGFPDSDIVSRVHGDIRKEADAYYFEDTGSSNGTYINNVPLPPGNRHRLRAGDRIALGKGDKFSFIFQVTD